MGLAVALSTLPWLGFVPDEVSAAPPVAVARKSTWGGGCQPRWSSRSWTSSPLARALERVDDEVLAHISPAHSENINFFGSIDVDIEGELAQFGPAGHRPLRVRDTLF